jgi:hypothetical protein
MAEQGSTNISQNAMVTLVGASTGTGLKALCQHANVNISSWYRSKPVTVNSSTKLLEAGTPRTSNYKLGDFRRYNHIAATSSVVYNSTPDNFLSYGPGTGSVSLTLAMYLERVNIMEATGTGFVYLRMEYYASSANRAARTNLLGSYHRNSTSPTDENILTPEAGKGGLTQPPGHTNNESKSPISSFVLLQDSAFDPTLIGDGNTLYVDAFLTTVSSTDPLMRLGTAVSHSYKDILLEEKQYPIIRKSPPFITPVCKIDDGAGGSITFTFMAIKVTNSSGGKNGVNFTESNGSTSYGGAGFYWYVYGQAGSNYYRIGSRKVTAVLELPGGTTFREFAGTNTTILNDTKLNNAGSNSNQNSSGTLAASQSWIWMDSATIDLTSVDWTTSTVLNRTTETYDLGTISPT